MNISLEDRHSRYQNDSECGKNNAIFHCFPGIVSSITIEAGKQLQLELDAHVASLSYTLILQGTSDAENDNTESHPVRSEESAQLRGVH